MMRSTMTINGAYGNVDIPYPAGASAKDMAALINAQTEKTGVSATGAVAYNDVTTGNIVVALAATTRAGRMMPVVSAVAGKFIKQINSVTLSATTGTAGNFGITATRPRTAVHTFVANKYETFDWAQLGSPEVPSDACLALIMLCNTTTTGTVRGQGKIAHG